MTRMKPRRMDEERIAELERENDALRERTEAAEEVLACSTDLANSWAREYGVSQGKPEGLRDLIDRLWGEMSRRYFDEKGRAERFIEGLERRDINLECAEKRLAQVKAERDEARTVRDQIRATCNRLLEEKRTMEAQLKAAWPDPECDERVDAARREATRCTFCDESVTNEKEHHRTCKSLARMAGEQTR